MIYYYERQVVVYMKQKKLIKWLFLMIWMLIIFIFSNQAHSGQATHDIIEHLLPSIKTNTLIDIINFFIRKSAHLTEYFILALLTMSLLKEYSQKEKTIILFSILYCFLYACTDEFHQSFVPGRTAAFKDVLIDTTGAIIAIALYTIYTKKYSMKKSKS